MNSTKAPVTRKPPRRVSGKNKKIISPDLKTDVATKPVKTTSTKNVPSKRSAPKTGPAQPKSKADWYKDAVIYEMHVKSFFDANADGIGDFKGLTRKLDYLEGL